MELWSPDRFAPSKTYRTDRSCASVTELRLGNCSACGSGRLPAADVAGSPPVWVKQGVDLPLVLVGTLRVPAPVNFRPLDGIVGWHATYTSTADGI